MYSFFDQLLAVAIVRFGIIPFLLSRTAKKKPFLPNLDAADDSQLRGLIREAFLNRTSTGINEDSD
ncbi:hypothetical protein QUA04_00035 [Microcoleus sp. S13_C5]